MSIADDLTRLEQLRDRGSLSPDEFQRAKNKLLAAGQPRPAEPLVQALNGLRRSASDRWLGGVCGGLALATGVEAWLWRILFVVCFAMGGFGLLAYVLLWVFVPLEHNTTALTTTP